MAFKVKRDTRRAGTYTAMRRQIDKLKMLEIGGDCSKC